MKDRGEDRLIFLTVFLSALFFVVVYVVSHTGDMSKVDNNEYVKAEVTTTSLHAGVLQDLMFEPNVIVKSKLENTISTMPESSTNNDELIDNISEEFPINEEEVGKVEEVIEEESLIQEEPIIENTCSNRWNITLTEDEIYLLGCIVMLESGGESDKGQQAVIEVIFNRMIDDYFGGSLYEVLSSKGQFTTWKNRNSSKAYPSDRVITNIHKVLNGETNILPFKTVYFARSPQNKRIQTEIGGHVFCNK